MNTTERIHTDHTVIKRLGNWTTAGSFEIRSRHGQTVIDLRSPALPSDLDLRLELDHSMVKLLVPEDATIDQWDLRWTGRGKVKDWQAPAQGERRIRLSGTAAGSEIRVHRGGVAIVSAMLTREYLDDARQARRNGTYPTVDDPTR
ncbi:hypothetical protein [Nonomuraea sediminis]|uniref:hypothetical protein n=1 Tax=Nonomuraea sediminis TaxID=2835864 RepID=UPI001BDD2F3E|nr:hypothetical protein [Nonomuraea sediminis]